MKSAKEISVFKEGLREQCMSKISDKPKYVLQGIEVSAIYLTKHSFQLGQSQGLRWIDELGVTDDRECMKMIRNRILVERRYLSGRVKASCLIAQKVIGICDSLIGAVIDYIYSVYTELESRVANEREASGFNGPCESLQDVVSLGLISALYWALDEI